MKIRGFLSFLILLTLTLFAQNLISEPLTGTVKSSSFVDSEDCVDAPNVVSIEFQQSSVTLPSHETLLIQATLKDSSGSVIGIDPDWSASSGSISPIIGLQQARFTPGDLDVTTIWACAGSVNESITVNVVQGVIESLVLQSTKENFSADEGVKLTLLGEDIRGNVFELTPPKSNWTYPEGSVLSISDDIIWSPKIVGWHNVSVQESGIISELSFNISHGLPVKLSILGDSLLITSDEKINLESVLVDINDNQWAVSSDWSTFNTEANEWITDLGEKAIFDGELIGSWKILAEYNHPISGQYFAAEYDVLVKVGELSQILLDGHGLTLTVDEVLDLNPRAIDSAGNLIQNIEMTWTINGQVSTGTLEENDYLFSTQEIGLYELQVISDEGGASITFDFINGEAVRIVVTETNSNQLTVKSGETIELLTEGEDQYGNRFALNVEWNLTNGTGVMEPSSRGKGYYDFKPGDASGFVIMNFSALGIDNQIVIEINPGEITKLRIEYDGDAKQGSTVRLLISAVDNSGNIVSFCGANSAIVTTESGTVIRENDQLYLKFKESGSTTIDVGCFGLKETFYLQVEDTILGGIFEDSQKLIIYITLIIMIAITVFLVIMIRRPEEYEDFEEDTYLPNPQIQFSQSSLPQMPIPQMPIPQIPIPQMPIPQMPIPQMPIPQIPIQQMTLPQAPSPQVVSPQAAPAPKVALPQAPAPKVALPQAPNLQFPISVPEIKNETSEILGEISEIIEKASESDVKEVLETKKTDWNDDLNWD